MPGHRSSPLLYAPEGVFARTTRSHTETRRGICGSSNGYVKVTHRPDCANLRSAEPRFPRHHFRIYQSERRAGTVSRNHGIPRQLPEETEKERGKRVRNRYTRVQPPSFVAFVKAKVSFFPVCWYTPFALFFVRFFFVRFLFSIAASQNFFARHLSESELDSGSRYLCRSVRGVLVRSRARRRNTLKINRPTQRACWPNLWYFRDVYRGLNNLS